MVGNGALRAVPTIRSGLTMVGTRSLSSGARSRDPLALPTLRDCERRDDDSKLTA